MKPITSDTQVYGIIGYPLGHSLSPLLHNYWLKKYHIDACYLAFPIEETAPVDMVIKALFAAGVKGVNVTIPYKEMAYTIADNVSTHAKNAKSVNCLVVDKTGTIKGENTDFYGFLKPLEEKAREVLDKNKNILIIGAGGVARTCAYALTTKDMRNISCLNRNIKRGQSLLEAFDLTGTLYNEVEIIKHLKTFDLIINATPQGLAYLPNTPIDINYIAPHTIIYDLIYNPYETLWLKQARARNIMAISGLDMFLYQAQLSFFHWFHLTPEIIDDDVYTLLRPFLC